MAKQSGLGDYVAVDDSGGTPRDLSTDVTSYEISNSQNLLDSTSISKSAMERIVGVGDGSISLNGIFDAASNLAHDVFKTKSGTRTVTIAIGGNTSTNPEINMECLVADYNLSRGDDGSLTWTATLNVSDGTVPTWGTV
jgi:hypothetical protein